MSDKEHWVITCRFPAWEQNGHTFEPFGVEYFLTTGITHTPDWPDEDERWLTYNPDEQIVAEFKKQYRSVIAGEFNGEILFIRPSSLVILSKS